jgi:membrane protein required for colicin V production
MNYIDYILLAMLVAMIIVGSKKGLIRELSALMTLILAVLVSINFMDSFSVWVYEKVGGSPMVVTFVSFIVLIGLMYAAFKLLGMGIARIVHLQKKGRKDQMGGAFIGFMRGWLVISFIFFLLFLLPMPASFYVSVENSFFGPTVLKTIPIMFESSSALHAHSPSFYGKVQSALELKKAPGDIDPKTKAEVDAVLFQINRFFNSGIN